MSRSQTEQYTYSVIHTSKRMGTPHKIPSRISFFDEKLCSFFYFMFWAHLYVYRAFKWEVVLISAAQRRCTSVIDLGISCCCFFAYLWWLHWRGTGCQSLIFSACLVLVVFRVLLDGHAVHSPLLLPGSCSHSWVLPKNLPLVSEKMPKITMLGS